MPSVEVNDLVRERMIKYGVVNIKLQETPTEDMYCIVADAVAETIKIILKGAYPLQNPNEEKSYLKAVESILDTKEKITNKIIIDTNRLL